MGTKKAKHRNAAAQAAVITVDVQTLTVFAFNAGVTVEGAQRILLEAPDWSYPELPCRPCGGRRPTVLVEDGWQGRRMLYCVGCGEVDLWV